LADPLAGEPGGRLFRTGDVGRVLEDGSLEFLGRRDQQVKVRGVRVELGEIEAALSSHPAIQGSAVTIRTNARGDLELVGYVVSDGEGPTASELRAHLRRILPEPMLPTEFVKLSALPFTASGKVDRRGLPSPAPGTRISDAPYEPPRTEVERRLAEIWASVLPHERIGLQDSFFDLGGHSLLATQVVSRIRSAFQVELPLRQIFDSPMLGALASRLAALVSEKATPEAPL
jgi:acyl carrier protein